LTVVRPTHGWLSRNHLVLARSETGQSKKVLARSETGQSKKVLARSETGQSKKVLARSETGQSRKCLWTRSQVNISITIGMNRQ
jgi:hypothetical protein